MSNTGKISDCGRVGATAPTTAEFLYDLIVALNVALGSAQASSGNAVVSVTLPIHITEVDIPPEFGQICDRLGLPLVLQRGDIGNITSDRVLDTRSAAQIGQGSCGVLDSFDVEGENLDDCRDHASDAGTDWSAEYGISNHLAFSEPKIRPNAPLAHSSPHAVHAGHIAPLGSPSSFHSHLAANSAAPPTLDSEVEDPTDTFPATKAEDNPTKPANVEDLREVEHHSSSFSMPSNIAEVSISSIETYLSDMSECDPWFVVFVGRNPGYYNDSLVAMENVAGLPCAAVEQFNSWQTAFWAYHDSLQRGLVARVEVLHPGSTRDDL